MAAPCLLVRYGSIARAPGGSGSVWLDGGPLVRIKEEELLVRGEWPIVRRHLHDRARARVKVRVRLTKGEGEGEVESG